MSKYSNEEEQLIEWFQKNYKNILVGLFLGLSIGFGFNYFQDMKSNTQHELSLKYEAAIEAYNNNDNNKILDLSEDLNVNHSDNIYTTMLNLYAAKIKYSLDEIKKSEDKLMHIIENEDDSDLKALAAIRLSRLFISQKKLDDAESIIRDHGNKESNPLSLELLGDISFAKNDYIKARNYYNNLLKMDIPPNKVKIITSKINSINEK